MKVKNYQELIVWQKAMDLVEDVYKSSKDSPREEIYALTSQIRRAAVSIPSNIAEGQGRRTTLDFLRHLSICLRFTARSRNANPNCEAAEVRGADSS